MSTSSEAINATRPMFIRIGKGLTDRVFLKCKIDLSEPLACLKHDSNFLLRDPVNNSTIGIGKVLKLKQCDKDPVHIRKAYQSSVLYKKLTNSLKHIQKIRNSIGQKDEVAQLK